MAQTVLGQPPVIATNGVVDGALSRDISPGSGSASWGRNRPAPPDYGIKRTSRTTICQSHLTASAGRLTGKDALIYSVSPSQINAPAPSGPATGPVNSQSCERLNSGPQKQRYIAAVNAGGTLIGNARLLGTAVAAALGNWLRPTNPRSHQSASFWCRRRITCATGHDFEPLAEFLLNSEPISFLLPRCWMSWHEA